MNIELHSIHDKLLEHIEKSGVIKNIGYLNINNNRVYSVKRKLKYFFDKCKMKVIR